MYSIKIMSGENKADSDVSKGFKMILVEPGDAFEFGHNTQGEPIVTINTVRDGEHVTGDVVLTGNTYVLSHTGKTIASFWANKKPVRVSLDANDPDPMHTVALIQEAVIAAGKEPEAGITQDYLRYQEDILLRDRHGLAVTIPDKTNGTALTTVVLHRKGDVILDEQGNPMLAVTGLGLGKRTSDDARVQHWLDCGLTEHQIELLQNGPTKLASSASEREIAQRFRVDYLTSQGIPHDIAMQATKYLLGADTTTLNKATPINIQ